MEPSAWINVSYPIAFYLSRKEEEESERGRSECSRDICFFSFCFLLLLRPLLRPPFPPSFSSSPIPFWRCLPGNVTQGLGRPSVTTAEERTRRGISLIKEGRKKEPTYGKKEGPRQEKKRGGPRVVKVNPCNQRKRREEEKLARGPLLCQDLC